MAELTRGGFFAHPPSNIGYARTPSKIGLNDDNQYTANDICKMIEFLVDNIYVRFGGQLFRQMVGIPMGTKCWLTCFSIPTKMSV